MMRRYVAGVEMDLRGAPIVAGDEAVQNFGQETSLLVPEPAHDAEVDGDQLAARVHEQIARVHVGVKKAVAHGLTQKTLDHGATQPRQVKLFGHQRGTIR